MPTRLYLNKKVSSTVSGLIDVKCERLVLLESSLRGSRARLSMERTSMCFPNWLSIWPMEATFAARGL